MTTCGTHVMASVQDLDKCSASKGASYAIPCYPKYSWKQSIMIHCDQVTYSLFDQ